MALTPGTRLGHFEITTPLGAGGMGEVYRARDTRLGRDVAVKVLPGHLSSNPDLRARFEREARSVSSLNHPHICTLHDIGQEKGIDYLVMELVEGETLADRLSRGPLATSDVIRIGMQVADALDRAHRAGIIHRDLKPGNIMLTRSGAKLMDFGLARATGLVGPSRGSGVTLAALTQSPTLAQPLTAEGTIVGTFQYMAPEQLEGKEADARSDIWALGCVLYEMSTGRRAFEGTSQASLIGAIMYKDPRPLAEIMPMSPPALDRLVRACLVKDPQDRLQSAHDVKLQLQWIAEPGSAGMAPAAGGGELPTPQRRAGWQTPAIAAAILVLGGLAGALLSTLFRPADPDPAPLRFTILAPPRLELFNDPNQQAISPDGKSLVFLASDSTGQASLWLRSLASLDARELPGTRNAELPFWSPDSRQIGFFSDGKLRRTRATGGNPDVICDAATGRGASWSPAGTIVFSPSPTGPLFQVPASGGRAEMVTVVDSAHGESAHRWPSFLPDGKRFTYAVLPAVEGQYACYVGSLGSSERTPLFSAGSAPRYAAPGFLLFVRGGAFMAQRFDPRKLKLSGDTFTIGDSPAATNYTAAPGVSASTNGIISWVSAGKLDTRLVWWDRSGRQVGKVDIPLDKWGQAFLSPDGRHALVEQELPSGDIDLWTVDLTREVANRLTFQTGKNTRGVWSPDGREIVYASTRKGTRDLYRRAADGSGGDRLFYESTVPFKSPASWSPDGKWIVFGEIGGRDGWNIMVIPAGGGSPAPFLATPFDEQDARISPDGRWILYTSNESGSPQAYVQSFPSPGGKQQVTKTGAFAALWSPRGDEIFLLRPDLEVVSVPFNRGAAFSFGVPRDLFRISPDVRSLDSTPDGERFLMVVAAERAVPGISMAVNWPEGLEH